MIEASESCEVCGSIEGVRAFGIDYTPLCPEHYREAERNVAAAERAISGESRHDTDVQTILDTRDEMILYLGVRRRREAVLITEVERLRAALDTARRERDALHTALRELAAISPLYVRVGYSHWSCWYCAARIDNPGKEGGHQAGCPWAKAAAQLAALAAATTAPEAAGQKG